MRQYQVDTIGLKYTGLEVQFIKDGQNVINHPTGLARHPGFLPLWATPYG